MKKVLAAAIGDCIHGGGVLNFLKLAETEGYQTKFLGQGIPVKELIASINEYQPDLVAVSYRLTPESAQKLFAELKKSVSSRKFCDTKFVFGGTPPVAKLAQKSGIFDRVFAGTEAKEEVVNYLKGVTPEEKAEDFAHTLLARIKQTYPYPLLRHHFGRPTLKETVEGIKKISEAKVFDVLSIGPDQNAQEHFFRPEGMDSTQDGAGGVPLRKTEDLEEIYQATRRGNYPLVRCYAGTRDLIKWAEMSTETIKIAWGAIPLCWYSVLDGRSTREEESAITENQETIKWYAQKGTPVEVNEAHQWGLRDAHDSLTVAMAFLAAYNAKSLGVRNYVGQYMFNTPPQTSPKMDLAKMLAAKEMIESLVDKKFTVLTEVRAGLGSLSSDSSIAKGQLSGSGVLSLALKPHILHVVGFSEGDHAINADELIESCKIVHGVLKSCLTDFPDLTVDKDVQARKKELLKEAKILLEAIKKLAPVGNKDPWSDPKVITKAIATGLLDAPLLKGNKIARGDIRTRIINGQCWAVDKQGKKLTESQRIKNIEF